MGSMGVENIEGVMCVGGLGVVQDGGRSVR